MTRSSFAASIDEIFALLADTSGNPVAGLVAVGVKKVYDYEPRAGEMVKPIAITLSPAGMSPYEWQIALRVYVTADLDAKTAQDALVNVVVAVDTLMVDGPGDFSFDFVAELDAFVATDVFAVPRADSPT